MSDKEESNFLSEISAVDDTQNNDSTALPSPPPRFAPFVVSGGGVLYLWGGSEENKPENLFTLGIEKKTWSKIVTVGSLPPPKLGNGGCSIANGHLYLYGGGGKASSQSSLLKLNTKNWTWSDLNVSPGGISSRKTGCLMVTFRNQLVIVGGRYKAKPASIQPGSTYEEDWTNEVYCYDLTTGNLKLIACKPKTDQP